ncbi:MAG: hypothetical protein Q9M89_05355 [Persephonella sp.]|nr:hypothetical protein [Persephonella sp.]
MEQIENPRKELKVLRYEEENINKEITYLLEDKGKYEQKIEDS